MLTHPNPVEWPNALRSGPDDVGRHRSLYCIFYDHCLGMAIRRDWRSWSCDECHVFTRLIADGPPRFP